MSTIDFQKVAMTFALGASNEYITAIGTCVEQIISDTKIIAKDRAKWIKQQCELYSKSEKVILQNALMNDQEKWQELARETINEIKKHSGHGETGQKIVEQMNEFLSTTIPSGIDEILPEPVLDVDFTNNIRAITSHLLFLNDHQITIRCLISDIFDAVSKGISNYKSVIDKIHSNLVQMQKIINLQMQLDVDFSSDYPQTTLPREATDLLIRQRSKIEADIAYIEWTDQNLQKLASEMFRRLRRIAQ